jgi:hypothetical protein
MSLGWVPVPPVFGILTCIFLIFHLEPAAVLLGAALAVVGVLLAFVCCRKSA